MAETKNVIILGCGRIGSTLARSLASEGHKVCIIDQKADAFRRLGTNFDGTQIIGNGIDEEVLKRAGITSAHAFIAVTNGDNTNIMSAQIAKVKFNVPKVIMRIYDPIRAFAYRELGIETLCTTVLGARLIMDYILELPQRSVAEYCALSDEEIVK